MYFRGMIKWIGRSTTYRPMWAQSLAWGWQESLVHRFFWKKGIGSVKEYTFEVGVDKMQLIKENL